MFEIFYFYFMQKQFLNEKCLREYCVAYIMVGPQATDRGNKVHHKKIYQPGVTS